VLESVDGNRAIDRVAGSQPQLCPRVDTVLAPDAKILLRKHASRLRSLAESLDDRWIGDAIAVDRSVFSRVDVTRVRHVVARNSRRIMRR